MSHSSDKKPNGNSSGLEDTKPEANNNIEPPVATHVEIIKMLRKEDNKLSTNTNKDTK